MNWNGSAVLTNCAVKPFCVFTFGGEWKCVFQEVHTRKVISKACGSDTRIKPLGVTPSRCFHGIKIFTLCSSTTSWKNPWNTLLLRYWFIFSTFGTKTLSQEVVFAVKPLPLEKRQIPTENHSGSTVNPNRSQCLFWCKLEKSRLNTIFQTMMPWPFGDTHPVICCFKLSWNPPS